MSEGTFSDIVVNMVMMSIFIFICAFLSLLFSGCLPKREVLEIVRQYNSAFNLNLNDFRVNELMTDTNNLDKSGNVLLQPFLAKLSV